MQRNYSLYCNCNFGAFLQSNNQTLRAIIIKQYLCAFNAYNNIEQAVNFNEEVRNLRKKLKNYKKKKQKTNRQYTIR